MSDSVLRDRAIKLAKQIGYMDEKTYKPIQNIGRIMGIVSHFSCSAR